MNENETMRTIFSRMLSPWAQRCVCCTGFSRAVGCLRTENLKGPPEGGTTNTSICLVEPRLLFDSSDAFFGDGAEGFVHAAAS
jgi:hypothetical protein